MRIKSFSIKNYRSIIETYKVPLDENFTVLVGKNNEGKSNILRALNGVFYIIKLIKNFGNESRSISNIIFREPIRSRNADSWYYDWEKDFPISKQKNKKTETVFTIYFTLSDKESKEFKKKIGSDFRDELPFQITLNINEISFSIPKLSYAGRGAFKAKIPEIAQFISEKLDSLYIPAIRPADLSVNIISNIVSREINNSLKDNEDYKKAREIIDKQHNMVLKRTANSLTKELQKIIPEIKSLEIVPESRMSERYMERRFLSASEINVDDGVKTPIDYKGDGLKSLIALGLMKSAKHGELTIAIEEPESHLHPEAIRKIKQIISEISKNNQVIITTHSPIMVNRDRVSSNIIIAKNSAKPCDNIREIREQLGVVVSDNLLNAEKMILVEGTTDKKYLEKIISQKSAKLKELISKGEMVIEPLHRASLLKSRVARLCDDFYKIAVLLDYDQAGKDAFRQAKLENLLTDKNTFFTITSTANNESEFEDLLKLDMYKNYIETKYSISIPDDFLKQNKKWSDKLRKLLSDNGKWFEDNTIKSIKHEIADLITQDSNNSEIIRNDIKIIDNFISFLEQEF